MIEFPHPVPIESLASLKCENLAIRSNASDGFTVFLDFRERSRLSSSSTEKSLSLLQSHSPPNGLSFSGWVGFFGYEFLAANLGLSLKAKRDLEVPDGWFGRPETILRLSSQGTSIESREPTREKEIESLLIHSLSKETAEISFPGKSLGCNLDFERYERIFAQAQQAILDGETYQIKISQRFEAESKVDPLRAFAKLHQANPAPESFLLQTPDFSLVSCSPEVVIDKVGQRITTRPIGGTYERSTTMQDPSVIERFLSDPKEVSEHNMLVDLERNDLSALCIPGTVRIERFREVETYAHLHHLVSTISGELRPDLGLREILRAMLPGGSITGCPKIRTMEWIDRLEPCFRGPYTGSFGTLADNGDLRLNLIIRAMLVLKDKCYTQAGGGIVVDSTPGYEFKENRIKAQALLDLLQ
ncbi:MAG: anthranilate synthase component I family protein [Verrucomicrobiota bacterium]|nr:anthranilate synthase component I family protein [Verrucomicrobiota bacterium]